MFDILFWIGAALLAAGIAAGVITAVSFYVKGVKLSAEFDREYGEKPKAVKSAK